MPRGCFYTMRHIIAIMHCTFNSETAAFGQERIQLDSRIEQPISMWWLYSRPDFRGSKNPSTITMNSECMRSL